MTANTTEMEGHAWSDARRPLQLAVAAGWTDGVLQAPYSRKYDSMTVPEQLNYERARQAAAAFVALGRKPRLWKTVNNKIALRQFRQAIVRLGALWDSTPEREHG